MAETLPPITLDDIEHKMELKGVVKKIDLAGALIDVGLEQEALLHISQIKAGHVNNVSDFLAEEQDVIVWVRKVDKERGRVMVTMIKPPAVSWGELSEGQVHTGEVVRIEKFGVFVDIGAERPGLVHISELSNKYVEKPEDVVQKGQDVEVKVIGVNRRKRQIDLSMKALMAQKEELTRVQPEGGPEEELPTAMALAWERAMSKSEDEGTEDTPQAQQQSAKQDEILRRTLEQHGQE